MRTDAVAVGLTLLLFLAGGARSQVETNSPPTPIPEIQNRAVSGQPAVPPGLTALPGEFAIHTYSRSTYITAVDGGGRTSGAVNTLSKSIGPYERFKLSLAPQDPRHTFIQTYSGNFLTAVGGGGQLTDVFHTDATQPLA
jgi:hypothetical protein